MKVTKELVQVLKDTRSILEKPNSWGRRCIALDNLGKPVYPTEAHASRFCVVGAIARACNVDYLYTSTLANTSIDYRIS
jgi:hypothetical protein